MVSKAGTVDFDGKYDSQQPQLREQKLPHSKAIAEDLTLDFQQRAFLSDILLDVAKTRLQAAGVPYQCLRYTPCFEANTAFKETQNGVNPPRIWNTLQGVIESLRSTNTLQNENFIAMNIEDFDDQMYAGITSISELYEKPNVEVQNLRTLWSGLGAQLARDVPFSAICWATLEPMRRRILGLVGDEASIGTVLAANFSAGFFAASVAAAATCPLDVANTRRHFQDPTRALKMTTRQTLLEIWREGGVKGIFRGVGGRAGRAGPSVGIVVALYETAKYVLYHGKGYQ